MSTNFEYYKVFYYVAKYKNFTHAAQVLLTNQPSVTRYIHLLESDLGCRLFVRSKHGVSLTPEGELLYDHVRIACESFFEGEEQLQSVRTLTEGTVYIGATEMAFRCFLLEKLKPFRKEYPKIKLKIASSTSPQSIVNLLSGTYEFDLVTTPLDIKAPLVMKEVRPLHDILICNPDYFPVKASSSRLTELVGPYPFVSLSPSTVSRTFYDTFFSKQGLTFRPDIEVSSLDLLIPLISQGTGIGFIPKELVESQLADGSLQQIKLTEEMPHRAICIVWDKQRPLSLATKKLFERLTQPN